MATIDNNILEEVKLVQTMIRYFFINNCNIDDQKLNLLEELFSQTSVKYSDIESHGRAYYDTKSIEIKNTLFLNTERVISYLIHEYCHIFVNRDFNINGFALDKTFNEGIADTFSDLVINYYCHNHQNITCNERTLQFNIPYDSYSCYLFQNSWVRTLLYPLEKTGKDKDAILELILGNPIKFFELTMGKDYAQTIPVNENGFPSDISISYQDMYMQNINDYHNINTDSFYYRRNFILPAFIIQERIEEKTELNLYNLKDSHLNEYFISYVYFDKKKIYEIESTKLIEFFELYWKAMCPEKEFIKGIGTFIDMKMKELTEEDINNHSFEILKNIIYILKTSKNHIDNIGIDLEYIILLCLNKEIEKIKNSQTDNISIQKLYNTLYPDALNFFKNNNSETAKNIYEILISIEELFKSKITPIDKYIELAKNMVPTSNGTSKKSYDFGDFILLESNYPIIKDKDITIEIFEKLNKLGINTYQILASTKVNNKYYILETKMPGTPIQEYTPKSSDEVEEKEHVTNYINRLKELSQNKQILKKFAEDYFTLINLGIFVDPSKTTNFHYNQKKGISFLDLTPNKHLFNEKLIMHYIMYTISWCQSNSFTEEQIKNEQIYLTQILDNLTNICIELGKEPNIYMNNINGNPLTENIQKRKEYRYEYSVSQKQNTKK